MSAPYYAYVLVRRDLPIAVQLVQVGHACLEAGASFPQPSSSCRLVVLPRDSEQSLVTTVQEAEYHGIPMRLFHEPDGAVGYTAACSAPVRGRLRRFFRRIPLWEQGK